VVIGLIMVFILEQSAKTLACYLLMLNIMVAVTEPAYFSFGTDIYGQRFFVH